MRDRRSKNNVVSLVKYWDVLPLRFAPPCRPGQDIVGGPVVPADDSSKKVMMAMGCTGRAFEDGLQPVVEIIAPGPVGVCSYIFVV